MIVDKVWKLTNTVRVGLDDRSSHSQEEWSDLTRRVRQYLPVPATSVSPERFFP
jgi:hypothetical protein